MGLFFHQIMGVLHSRMTIYSHMALIRPEICLRPSMQRACFSTEVALRPRLPVASDGVKLRRRILVLRNCTHTHTHIHTPELTLRIDHVYHSQMKVTWQFREWRHKQRRFQQIIDRAGTKLPSNTHTYAAWDSCGRTLTLHTRTSRAKICGACHADNGRVRASSFS